MHLLVKLKNHLMLPMVEVSSIREQWSGIASKLMFEILIVMFNSRKNKNVGSEQKYLIYSNMVEVWVCTCFSTVCPYRRGVLNVSYPPVSKVFVRLQTLFNYN